jgi:ribosomal protein L7/L12
VKGKLTNKKAVEDWVRKGDRVNAMKEYMRQTGAGLKDSKDAVDAMMRELKK